MTDKIVHLAEHAAAKQDPEDPKVDGELFLLDEGLALLAGYRSISDPEVRQRIRDAVDAAARGEAIDIVYGRECAEPSNLL